MIVHTLQFSQDGVRVPIAVAESHVHLTAAVIEQLFCDHYRLHVGSVASQPTQFAALESVTLLGPNGRRLRGVKIIGPPRAANQIEISRTDAQLLGIRAPTRESGDLIGTPGIIVEGPRSRVALGTGVICAHRHLHASPEEAARLSLKDRQWVAVATSRHNRSLLFEDVLVRVSPQYRLEFHLDSDEANAAGVRSGDEGILRQGRGLSGPDAPSFTVPIE